MKHLNIIICSLLVASCGGDSSSTDKQPDISNNSQPPTGSGNNNNSVKIFPDTGDSNTFPYTAADYELSSVSQDTMEGTWVALSSIDNQSAVTQNMTSRSFFVITGDESNQRIYICGDDESSDIEHQGDKIVIEGNFIGLNGSYDKLSNSEFRKYNEDQTVNTTTETVALKISSSTDPIGSISINHNGNVYSDSIYCLNQMSGNTVTGSITFFNSEISTGGHPIAEGHVLLAAKLVNDENIANILNSIYMDVGDFISFTSDQEDYSADSFTFNVTKSDEYEFSGTIQAQSELSEEDISVSINVNAQGN